MRVLFWLGRLLLRMAVGAAWLAPVTPPEAVALMYPGQREDDLSWHPEGFSGAPPTDVERRLWAEIQRG